MHVISPHAYPFGDKYAALDAARMVNEAADAAQKQMRSDPRQKPTCDIPSR